MIIEQSARRRPSRRVGADRFNVLTAMCSGEESSDGHTTHQAPQYPGTAPTGNDHVYTMTSCPLCSPDLGQHPPGASVGTRVGMGDGLNLASYMIYPWDQGPFTMMWMPGHQSIHIG